jgi:acylphosphatase
LNQARFARSDGPNGAGMATVCKRVTYSGQVQGVGFRYTARQVASGFPVAGYVRNLSNGDVELVAEGESTAVTAFLNTVAERMRGYITQQVVRDEAPGGYSTFEIRH